MSSDIQSYLRKAKAAVTSMDTGDIEAAAELCCSCIMSGGRLLFCGNGGSAADSLHLAAEIVGRFRSDRPGLPALALSSNIATITAVANDYAFDRVFARQVEALGCGSDLLVAISTSGNSPSVLEAVRSARKKAMKVVGLTGSSGGKLADLCDVVVHAPSEATSHIQECLLIAGHAICLGIEERAGGGGDVSRR